MNFNRRAAMDLQGDEAALEYPWLGFHIVHRADAVQTERNVVALNQQTVFVPAGLVEHRHRLLRRSREYLLAPRFVIQASPILLADVRLIAEDLVRSLPWHTTELPAAIAHVVTQTEHLR